MIQVCPNKSKMADGRHLKVEKIAISQSCLIDFNEIWYASLDLTSHKNFELLQIRDGKGRHYEYRNIAIPQKPFD